MSAKASDYHKRLSEFITDYVFPAEAEYDRYRDEAGLNDHTGQWYRSYGNELWEFSSSGLMARREASINDVPIDGSERRYFGPRPTSEHGQEIPLW